MPVTEAVRHQIWLHLARVKNFKIQWCRDVSKDSDVNVTRWDMRGNTVQDSTSILGNECMGIKYNTIKSYECSISEYILWSYHDIIWYYDIIILWNYDTMISWYHDILWCHDVMMSAEDVIEDSIATAIVDAALQTSWNKLAARAGSRPHPAISSNWNGF